MKFVFVVFAVSLFAQFNSSFFAGHRRFLIELSCCCCWWWCCCSIVIFVVKLNGNAIVFKRANLLQYSFIALSRRVLSTLPLSLFLSPSLSVSLSLALALVTCYCHLSEWKRCVVREREADALRLKTHSPWAIGLPLMCRLTAFWN